MSFHGTTGTGKNFVTSFIAKALYKKGLDSKYVHQYGRSNFPEISKISEYREKLTSDIIKSVKECPLSLFIFDEIDNMPPGVFDTITTLLDHNEKVDGIIFNQAIFIFLSNHGGIEISNILNDYYMKHKLRREGLQWSDLENVLKLAIYNYDGGLQKAKIIESALIDHYIPFLPLEREHVIGCIETAAKRINTIMTNDIKMYEFIESFSSRINFFI